MSVRSLNQVQLVGNLTADPQMRSTNNGTPVASFSIATNRSYTDSEGQFQEAAEFHNIVGFGKTAEICDQLLQKGSMVFIQGRLQTRSWDSDDGHKNYRTEIVIDQMILLARGKSTGGSDDGSGSYMSGSTTDNNGDDNNSTNEVPEAKKPKTENVSSEEIPF